jgi:hypothetical protein
MAKQNKIEKDYQGNQVSWEWFADQLKGGKPQFILYKTNRMLLEILKELQYLNAKKK